MKTLLALILFCASGAHGQILIYKMIHRSTFIGNGLTTKESAGGYVVEDLATGAAAEFLFYSWEPKGYTVRSNTVTIDTVDGGGKFHTVFSEAAAGTNSSSRAAADTDTLPLPEGSTYRLMSGW